MNLHNQQTTMLACLFALLLTFSSPAFAQYFTLGGCQGNCRLTQPAPAAAAPSACAPCQRVQTYSFQQTTFAPFGGFFRNLFGGSCCQYQYSRSGSQCAVQSGCASLSRVAGAACAAGQCEEKTGAPQGSLIDRTTGKEYVLEPGDENTPPAWREVAQDSETCEPCEAAQTCEDCEDCEECESCQPCEAVRSTWLEKKLFDCANAQRRAAGLRPLLFDGRLIEWARLNSYRQASYCRLGHFTGRAAEIAGEGYATPEAAVNGWLTSAPHRALLLNGRYTRCGAACYRGANGKLYWTMCFF